MAKNKLKTAFIVSLITLFVMMIVYFIAYMLDFGAYAIYIALAFSFASSFFSYFFSDALVIKISGAVPMDTDTESRVRPLVEKICTNNALPVPKLYIVNDSSPNAFATGRSPKKAVVCVTRGLLNILDKEELEGVLAHELAHVMNYDMLLSTVAAIMIGFVVMLSDWAGRSLFWRSSGNSRKRNGGIVMILGLVLMLLAPLAGMMLRMALSRNREFIADATGASYTKNPSALASALEKLEDVSQPVQRANNATASLYIANPFKGGNIRKLFRTHPTTAERVIALRRSI